MTTIPTIGLLTVIEIADHLRLSVDSARRLVASGALPGIRVRGKWRVRTDTLQRFLDGEEFNAKEETG